MPLLVSSKHSRTLTLMTLLLVTALIITACGGVGGSPATGSAEPAVAPSDEPKETDPTEPSDDKDKPPSVDDGDELFADGLERLFNPTGARDILEKFSVLSYRWENFADAQSQGAMEVRFQWLGQEEVGGETTDKISLTVVDGIQGTTDEMEMWLGADGTAVRILADGDEIPPEVAGFMSDALIGVLLIPFQQFDVIFRSPLEAGAISITSHSTEKAQLFGHDAEIHSYRAAGSLPGHSAIELGVKMVSFSDFELMLEAEILAGGDNEKFVLTPLEMELR